MYPKWPKSNHNCNENISITAESYFVPFYMLNTLDYFIVYRHEHNILNLLLDQIKLDVIVFISTLTGITIVF